MWPNPGTMVALENTANDQHIQSTTHTSSRVERLRLQEHHNAAGPFAMNSMPAASDSEPAGPGPLHHASYAGGEVSVLSFPKTQR